MTTDQTITGDNGPIIIDTPDGIAFARLAALKGALSLQTKGMRLSRGTSATAIGKRDYGIKRNTASGQLPIVEQVVEAILQFRECAPEFQSWLGYQFTLALNAWVDEDTGSQTELLKRIEALTEPTAAEKQVIKALATVYHFEMAAKPSVRVLFREEV